LQHAQKSFGRALAAGFACLFKDILARSETLEVVGIEGVAAEGRVYRRVDQIRGGWVTRQDGKNTCNNKFPLHSKYLQK
jgi:hypothetical protein